MSKQLALWSSTDGRRTEPTQQLGVNAAEPSDHPHSGLGSLKVRLMLADGGAALFGFLAAFTIRENLQPLGSFSAFQHLWLMTLGVPGFAIGAAAARLYQARANERPSEEAANIVRAVALGLILMVVLAFGLQFKALSRLWVVLVAICVTLALVAERHVARQIFTRLRETGKLTRRIVLVGTDAHAIRLLHTYQRNRAFGYEVVGFVGDDDIGQRGGISVLGRLDDLERILKEQQANGVVVSLSSIGQDQVNHLTRHLTDAGYHVALSSTLADIDVTRLRPQQVAGQTMIYVEPVIRGGWRAVAKRAFDIVAAAGLLLLTAPVMLVGAIAIRLEAGGPVLFRQTRVGRNGELFTVLKLRTMSVDAEARKAELLDLNEADGPLFKMAHDPRITRVGRVLRKLSIDELPQLVCVLNGTMSMVGPRPALPDEVAEWDAPLHDRLRVLPGLTGMWQVSGRSDAGFEQYRRLDLYYVDNWSLAHDLRICVKTLGVVLSGKGAA